ncbi:MAG: tetratricopeptide repeat protein, partial [Archaeoglobaceae archaeon]
SDEDRSEALKRVAVALAEAGRFDEALKVARSIPYEYSRSWALISIAKALAEAGKFDKALEVAKSIFSEPHRSIALREVAKVIAEAGRFDEALKVARDIYDEYSRLWALKEVAIALAKAGRSEEANEIFDEALKVARSISDKFDRSTALEVVARALAEVGRSEEANEILDEALKAARSISDEIRRSAVLDSIARDLAEAGRFDEALKVARDIISDRLRSIALISIAEALAEAGRFDEALKFARSLSDGLYTRSSALSSVAKVIAEAGRFDEALEVARGIYNEYYRSTALGGIAEALAKAGRSEEANKIFDEALKVARSISSDEDRSGALKRVAVALAKAGRFDEVLKVARSIPPTNEYSRSWALSYIAEALAEAGGFDEALKIARSISDESWRRSSTLAEIAKTIAIIPKVKIEIPKRILTENDELEILLDSEVELENALLEFEGIKIEPVSIKKLKSEKIKIKPDFEPGKKNLKIRVSYDFRNKRHRLERDFDIEFRAKKVEEKKEKAKEEKMFLKYRIIALAGSGAFADVYKAIDESGKTVALKIYRRDEKAFIEEIGNFVQLTKRLNVPYVVKPLDFGSSPKPFVVMHFYPMTLRDLMERDVELKKKLRFMHRVARVLSYAHSYRIYHGDLKPENILVFEENGEYYPAIADWGGGYTPCYSAPELYRSDGRNLNAKSDVYSFGVILFELLTGERLFEDPLDYLERCENVRVEIPDKRLEEIVNSCLSKADLRPEMKEIEERIADYLLNVLKTSYSKGLKDRDALELISAYIDSGKIEMAENRIKTAEKQNIIPKEILIVMDRIIELIKLVYEYRNKGLTIPAEIFEQKYRGLMDLLDRELAEKISKDKFSPGDFTAIREGISPDNHEALLLCIERMKDIVIGRYMRLQEI